MSIDLDEDYREAYRHRRDPADEYEFIRTCKSFKINKYLEIRLDEFEHDDYIEQIDDDEPENHI